MSQHILQALNASLNELATIRTTAAAVVDQLRGGVNLETAYMIVDRYWDGNEASNLKVKLSGSFPKENGYAILSANFGHKLGVALSIEVTKEYITQVFAEITTQVERVLDIINSKDLNDPEVLMKWNDFRKEPARFIDLVNEGWYRDREKVVSGEIANWDGLRGVETDSIDNGNYLFLTDYRKGLADAQEKMEEDLFGYNDPTTYALGGLDDCMCRLIGMVKLTGLFAAYLADHTDEVTA